MCVLTFPKLSIVLALGWLVLTVPVYAAQNNASNNELPPELSIEDQEAIDEHKKQLFKIGYNEFNKKDYRQSAIGFYNYLQEANESDENYQWAHFFYGVSLEKLGYSHAAIDTFTRIATSKPNTKIVIYILSYFDEVSRKQPFDQELLIAQAINGTDYGFVDQDLAAMVHYHQGIYDTRFGNLDWAEAHFKRIPHTSIYYAHYLYHAAIQQIAGDEIDLALAHLSELLALDHIDPKLQDLAHWTSARLLFEKEQHEQAIAHYKAVKTPVTEQSSFLLERAWNQYKLDNPERAMGLLYAFEAPAFKRFFTPELFILKSLIYKSVCHYENTLSTVDAFYSRYQTALDAVYDRRTASAPEASMLLYMVLNDEVIKKQWNFIQLLEYENNTLEKLDNEALQQSLRAIYQLKLEQNTRALRINVDREYERLANLLLEYEENINLVRYEAGVDQYQSASNLRYKQTDLTARKQAVNKGQVIYRFQGEFWSDEFDDYKVHLADQCNKDQAWEVYFQ